MRMPMHWERKWRVKHTHPEVYKEALKKREPIDKKFNAFKRQFPCFVGLIYAVMIALSFKFVMAFYCFFYDLKMF